MSYIYKNVAFRFVLYAYTQKETCKVVIDLSYSIGHVRA